EGRRRLAYETELDELNERFGIGLAGEPADEAEDVPFTWEAFQDRLADSGTEIERNPRAFAQQVMQHIPAMMIVFLPLVALALKISYIGSKRYYVEHLVFALHYHSAVFLIFLLWILWDETAQRVTALQSLAAWISAAVWIYIVVYLYRSMRRVYGQ